jgi:hypothetical protein
MDNWSELLDEPVKIGTLLLVLWLRLCWHIGGLVADYLIKVLRSRREK